MLGSLMLYLKGRRRMMFQLSGFYCIWYLEETLRSTLVGTTYHGKDPKVRNPGDQQKYYITGSR